MQPNCFAPYDGSPCTCGDHISDEQAQQDYHDFLDDQEYYEYLCTTAEEAWANRTLNPQITLPCTQEEEDDLPF